MDRGQTSSSPFTGPLPLTKQYVQHHPNMTPTQSRLNPQIPSFQPNGSELQLYQSLPQTPPPSDSKVPLDALSLRDFAVNTHFEHARDIWSLEMKTKDNSELIKDTRDVVKKDVRFLYSQILELKQQLAAQTFPASIMPRGSPAGQADMPTDEFLQKFSQDKSAEVYIEEAMNYERTAARLREQAAELSPAQPSKETNGSRADPLQANYREAKSEFACCGATYASFHELLFHVKLSHAFDMHQFEGQQQGRGRSELGDNGSQTPTHVPPRRVRWTEQQASQPEEPKVADRRSSSQNGEESSVVTEWVPLAIRQMPASERVATSNIETFSFDFLQKNFNGNEWSPGFYFINKNAILPSQSYWVLDQELEPFLPAAPGLHGAKLTAFFNTSMPAPGTAAPDEQSYIQVPLFIRPKDGEEYLYYGNYSQRRFSDKLDFDDVMTHVPEEVRRHHAKELAKADRPEWVSNELRKHFWPKPIYEGPIPTNSAFNTPQTEASAVSSVSIMPEKRVMKALVSYADELKQWEKESKMRLSYITEDSLMKAFEKADEDEEPGLRLYFEYLQFEKYDQEFYEFMVELKGNPKLQGPFSDRGRKKGRGGIGGKMVSGKKGVETVDVKARGSDRAVPPHMRVK